MACILIGRIWTRIRLKAKVFMLDKKKNVCVSVERIQIPSHVGSEKNVPVPIPPRSVLGMRIWIQNAPNPPKKCKENYHIMWKLPGISFGNTGSHFKPRFITVQVTSFYNFIISTRKSDRWRPWNLSTSMIIQTCILFPTSWPSAPTYRWVQGLKQCCRSTFFYL